MTTLRLELSDADIARIAEAVASRMAALPPAQAQTTHPTHVTYGEAAELLRCSTRWVRHLVAVGRLRATRVGTGPRPRTLIPRACVEQLLAESTH